MSYSRPGMDSDLYVYEHTEGGYAVWLWAGETYFNATVPTIEEAANLVQVIREAGKYKIPYYLEADLREDSALIKEGKEPVNG